MKPTREEVLRLMRQASGGILTQVAEDPRCGYEIKVEELQTFAELLQESNECGSVPDDDKLDDLIVAVSNTSHECGAFDLDASTSSIDGYRVLLDATRAAEDALRQYVMALKSGISSKSHRPNEKDVVGEGK